MRMTTLPSHTSTAPADLPDTTLEQRLRDATDLLEAVAAERALLDTLDDDTRERLHRALATLSAPVDPSAR
jgi:hypothetical protein